MAGKGFDYKSAGVDIEAGERVIENIKGAVRATFRPEVLTELGGFSGLFEPRLGSFQEPVFSAATDGVGTKLKLAFAMGRHDTVGIDAVAMCVNDLLAQGAEPLFFLDYLAVGRIENESVVEIVSGVAEGCRQAGCALLGGETAEMPGFYPPGEYDLAGFAVGLVEKKKILPSKEMFPGDLLIGLASTGLHSNGFSLVRKVLLEHAGFSLEEHLSSLGLPLGEELLKPTKIYVPLVLPLLREDAVKGIAHITGGGITLNLPRILPSGLNAVVEKKKWVVPPVFHLLQETGRIEEDEMMRTFNMGVGMVLVVSPDLATKVFERLEQEKWPAWKIGWLEKGEDENSSMVRFV
ncbi:MAG TPA: phosphoribosylformylglycinamidine cyclo-ligase [Firmicutes bacterium]|jgi:phosphoribosylformylglycinamidine cyclo-ligase|nr:phosphoribosylformylglycinamidine cyclo-ligase [Bacillota bacterium]